MGIYSEDRTMLTVDPNAESKIMEGYSNVNDLYSIMEESIHDDSIIYSAIIESMASVLLLDEADGAKANKRAETICKVSAANTAKLAKAIAKNKSICAGAKESVSKASSTASKSVSKYQDAFNRNKDIASGSRFTIKYNEKALHCTSKDLDKFVAGAGKAVKAIASNCINIASNNKKEINSNKNNIFKVPALEKYAKDCCLCSEKESNVQGNPFTNGFTVKSLVNDINDAASATKALEKFNSDATQALDIFSKNISKLCDKVKNNKKEVSDEDMETIYALTALSTGISKLIIHTTKDILNAYKKHLNECIRVYIGVAKLKAARVVKEAKEPTTDPAIDVVKEEIEAVKNDDNLENSKKIEGEFEDDLDVVTKANMEKIINTAPEDETKKEVKQDTVKPADVPMNDGSAHEATEPTTDPAIDVVKEEIEAVKNDDNLENAKKIEGDFEDDLDLITDADVEKLLSDAPEDETKEEVGQDPVKPSDVPMNDGSAHEAAEPTSDPPADVIKEAKEPTTDPAIDTVKEECSFSDSTIIYTDTVDAVAEAYIIAQEIDFMLEMNI